MSGSGSGGHISWSSARNVGDAGTGGSARSGGDSSSSSGPLGSPLPPITTMRFRRASCSFASPRCLSTCSSMLLSSTNRIHCEIASICTVISEPSSWRRRSGAPKGFGGGSRGCGRRRVVSGGLLCFSGTWMTRSGGGILDGIASRSGSMSELESESSSDSEDSDESLEPSELDSNVPVELMVGNPGIWGIPCGSWSAGGAVGASGAAGCVGCWVTRALRSASCCFCATTAAVGNRFLRCLIHSSISSGVFSWIFNPVIVAPGGPSVRAPRRARSRSSAKAIGSRLRSSLIPPGGYMRCRSALCSMSSSSELVEKVQNVVRPSSVMAASHSRWPIGRFGGRISPLGSGAGRFSASLCGCLCTRAAGSASL